MPASTALQWLSLVGIIWLQSISGTNTNFPAYSSQLKHALSLSQLQLNNLAFASDAGKLFGWLAGLAAAYLPLWLVLLIGSALGLVGYGLQYLSMANQIPITLSYWQVFCLTVLAGNSICWINTVSYVVTIRNFPRNRQAAIGLTTSYQGLSAKIYTDFVVFLFSSTKRAKAYLLLNSILPLVLCVITSPFVKGVNEIDQRLRNNNMDSGFVVLFVITVATGVYSVISSLGLLVSSSVLNNVIGTGILLLVPLAVPATEKIRELVVSEKWNLSRERRVCDFNDHELGEVRVEEDGVIVKDEVERDNNIIVQVREEKIRELVTTEKWNLSRERRVCDFNDHELGGIRIEDGVVVNDEEDRDNSIIIGVREEIGVKKMLVRLDFWLYFLVYFSSVTPGLVFLNNLGQITESRRSSKTSFLVSLSSSFGFFGRLMPSLLDYYFSKSKYVVSRPGLIAVLVAPMAGSFFKLLNPTNLSLYISTAIIVVCTGAITSVSVSTTQELFGTENFSINHNVLVANIPIGSFLFGYLAALLYHKEGNGDGKCMGTECYRQTFIMWGSICSLGTVLALVLYVRTRKFYSR